MPSPASTRPAARIALRPRGRARARRRATRQRTRRPRPSSRRPSSTGTAARSSPSNDAPAAPRLTIQVLPAIGPPTMRSSSSFAKTTSGASCSSCARNRSAPKSRIALHDERSTLTRAPSARACSIARVGGEADGLAEQRVPRHVEMLAVREPRLVDLLGPELGGDAAVGAHRPLARGIDERDDHAVPRGLDRADELDAEVEQARRGEGARVVGAPLADEPRRCPRAPRPRPRRWPPGRPGRSTIREVASAPVASGCSSRTITSSTRSPRQQIVIAYDPRMERVRPVVVAPTRGEDASAPRARGRQQEDAHRS